MESARYIPSLDGVRALAALAVIVFHGGWLAGGWAGVQVFFVLSGFLITRILLDEREAAPSLRAYLGPFYRRRALRLLPLYVVFLGVLAGVHAVTGAVSGFEAMWPSLATYTYNWTSGLPNAPWDPAYGPLWSLAVEEQFYLVWPLLLWMLRGRKFLWACVALVVAGPLIRMGTAMLAMEVYGPRVSLFRTTITVYHATTSHLDAFAWGALAALWVRHRPTTRRTSAWMAGAVAGLLAIGVLHQFSLGSFDLTQPVRTLLGLWGDTMFAVEGGGHVWSYTVLNAFSAVLMVHLYTRGNRMLASRPLRFVGRISYGVYVFHEAVRRVLESAWTGWGLTAEAFTLPGALFLALWIVLTLGAAQASFVLIERPFLRLKRARSAPTALATRSYISAI